jgi:long-chain acyl-CoA synthetase
MYAEVCRVAELLTSLGLQKGDHIAICGANSAHWVIAYLAIAKMQGVSVTVMHTLMPEEIVRLVDFSDAKALFTDEDIWEELKNQSLPQVESVISLEDWVVLGGKKGEFNKSSLPLREELEVGFPKSSPEDLAMICFTSGTSGKAKGVMLSYENLTANIKFMINDLPDFKNQKTMSILPMAHIYGIYNEVLRALCHGTYIHICHRIDIQTLFVSYKIIRPYIAVLVPVLVDELLCKSAQTNAGTLYQSLMSLFGGKINEFTIGGGILSAETEEILIQNGIPFCVGYGMTECGPIISVSSTLRKFHRLRSAGKIVPTLTARISPAGEILVKGENVMLGYYKDPEATAAKIDKDGWLHTGDKGHLDEDGYLYVEGRLEQDIIVLPNGENIRPDNIEALINALPEVKESIVLARDGKLVAIAVPSSLPFREESEVGSLRRIILRNVNPSLPLFSQLYDVEITDRPLARTEKQTLKRYLYK